MSRDRIKKLLGMTTANGCTEAEAMAAAEKAARLMTELGLEVGDFEMDESHHPVSAGWGSVRSDLWAMIGVCTNTAMLITTRMGRSRISFICADPGPEIAVYLLQVTDRAITRELREFRASTWYKRRRTTKAKTQASRDFAAAMARRMASRLLDLFQSSISEHQRDIAAGERDRRYPQCVAAKAHRHESQYFEAADAGRAAGSSVTLAHGVGVGRGPALIGGRS
jgi:Protein of unknown function (DUF2786)